MKGDDDCLSTFNGIIYLPNKASSVFPRLPFEVEEFVIIRSSVLWTLEASFGSQTVDD
jgi:hypothetical protein